MAYVYAGDISAQNLFDLDKYRDIIPASIIDSVLQNTRPSVSLRYAPGDITNGLIRAYTENYARKAENYYKYGLNEHSDNIPTNITSFVPVSTPAEYGENNPHPQVMEEVEAFAGEPVIMRWYNYGRPNHTLLANYFFSKSPLYTLISRNIETNSKMRFISDDLTFIPHRYSMVGETLTVYAYRTYQEGPRWIVNRTLEIPFVLDFTTLADADMPVNGGISGTDNIHQVMYSTEGTRDFGAWFYEEDGEFEDIDGTVPVYLGSGSYPFAMLVDNGRIVNDDQLGEEYKTQTKRLLKKIDLDLDQIMDSMENPDDPEALKDVRDAFVLYGVNLDNDTEPSLQYLYEHFRRYYTDHHTEIDNNHQNWIDNYQSDPGVPGYSWMPFHMNRVTFNVNIRWMRVRIKNGNVDDSHPPMSDYDLAQPEPYVSEIDPLNNGVPYKSNGVEINKITKQIVLGTEYSDLDEPNSPPVNSHYLIIRKQLTETTFVEIVVFGVYHATVIRNYNESGQNVVGTVTVISTLDNIENGKFVIPVSYAVSKKFDSVIRSKILYESLMVVIHLFQQIHVPWYTNSSLWTLVRIVLAFATWGSSEIWVEGFLAVLQQLIVNYGLELLITEALVLLIDVVGGDVALILAAIAATISITMGKGDGAKPLFNLISAEQLMQGATLLIRATNQATADDFLELQEDIEAHEEYVREEQERIDALTAQIEKGTGIDVTKLITRAPMLDPGETPSDFFNRSIHITNPGVLSLDTIDSYTNTALILPEYKPELPIK